ncbi:alpha-ribazole phosphatase CobZ [Methanohalophilus levihalophilus]|uniref:alpha-ribazole phosphatase CobZ n=1 Tax=Methanohalophilus levihalophilus TaxID=1431282 RepID=UPI001AE9DF69|nr:alpha-ribazole phosphatase CobZ [Methanohalophilus levihalophilus]MBP2030185.1 alpha-ribazole phosphatase CobZ [Methanohalophilus levihalophilus]
MKLSDIKSKNLKENQPETAKKDNTRDILEILKKEGVTVEAMVDSALSLYTPHPGLETREIAENLFLRELKIAVSDPNLCMLIYAGILLEREGRAGQLPNISPDSYERDLTFIIADEVLGMSISKYISGDKGMFEFVRFDKQKPGILAELGPFMDDIVGGLIGGVSANMYTRGMAEAEEKNEKTKTVSDVIAG